MFQIQFQWQQTRTNSNRQEAEMCGKIAAWVKATLIPTIIDRKKSELSTTNDVISKEFSIKQFDNDGAFMMTICYKLNIVLDVGGEEHRLSVFVKVRMQTRILNRLPSTSRTHSWTWAHCTLSFVDGVTYFLWCVLHSDSLKLNQNLTQNISFVQIRLEIEQIETQNDGDCKVNHFRFGISMGATQ